MEALIFMKVIPVEQDLSYANDETGVIFFKGTQEKLIKFSLDQMSLNTRSIERGEDIYFIDHILTLNYK
jgi:hypothetical protein